MSSMEYSIPESWIEEVSDENQKYYYPEDGMLMINYTELDEPISNDVTRANFMEGFISGLDSFELISESEITVAGTTAYQYNINHVMHNEDYNTSFIFFDYDDGIISMFMASLPHADYSNEFESILSSIEFTDETMLEVKKEEDGQAKADEEAKKEEEKQAKADEKAKKEEEKQAKVDEKAKKEEEKQAKADAKAKKEEEKQAKVDEEAKKQDSKETAEEAYQRILEEYTVKMKKATPGLIEEYHDEAKDNTGGLEGLAELSNEKVMVLAEINNDGVGEMAEVMLKKGSGSYDEYEEWAGELMEVYMEEGAKITEAYMNSAM